MQLYINAIENHSRIAQDYYDVANSLRHQGTVMINKQPLNKQQLYAMGDKF